MIIADQRNPAVCIRPDNAQRAASLRIKRKKPVVLQQYAGFKCSPMGKGEMISAGDGRIGDGVIFAALITENAEHISCCEEPDCTACDVLFRNHAELIGMHNMLIGAAAVEVASGFQSFCDGFHRG